MALYLLTYDLRNERDYDRFHGELERFGAVWVLESVWCFELEQNSPQDLVAHFLNFIDQDDGLMVCEASRWATHQTNAPLLSSPKPQ